MRNDPRDRTRDPRPAPGKVVHYVADADTTLEKVLTHLGDGAAAIAEGRVFIGKTRATSLAAAVPRGARVALTRKSADALPDVCILHRTEGVLVVEKPAGLPTIGDGKTKSHTLLAATSRASGIPEVALHPTSRLDRDVSGVVTFATNPDARKALAKAREEGKYTRRYVAISTKAPTPEAGLCDARLAVAADPRFRKVDPKGEPASSRYATVGVAAGGALLALGPITGRTHQLRVHASHLGAPLLGDKTYGGPTRLTLPSGKSLGFSRVFLHCARVRIPIRGELVELVSPVPLELLETWLALGGDPLAWDRALAWDTLP